MTALFHSSPSLREERLPGGAHTSLILRKGQILRLTDIDGGANVSMMMLNPHEKSERLNLPMPGRLQPKLNQLHNLNRLACRNRVNADAIKRIANGGVIRWIVAR